MKSTLVKTALGFLLSSIAGAFIGSGFQYWLWSRQHNTEAREKYRAEATEVFKTASTRIDKCYYSLDKLYDLMKQGKDTGEIHKEWNRYQNYSIEYNQERNQTRALIDWYFGKSVREYFAPSLFNEFDIVEGKMDSAYILYMKGNGSKEELRFESIRLALEQLSRDVYGINLTMITAIKNGEVASFCTDRDK